MAQSTSSIYDDGTYLDQRPTWHDEDGPWKAEQIARMLEKNGVRPGSVVDVGCGTGRVLDSLSARLPGRPSLVGYDMSADAIAMGRTRGNDDIVLVAGDALDADTHDDLLLMIDVFEHVEDYIGFLRSFRDRADRFVFHVPLDMNVLAVLRMSPIVAARRQIGHLHYFARESALATLADAGYRVLDETYTAGGLELQRNSIRQKVARLPRRWMFATNPHAAARVLGGFSLLVLCQADT